MMKRIMLLCLVFMLLLSGCGAKPVTEDIPKLTITMGSNGDRLQHADTIKSFYGGCMDGKPMELTVRNVTEEGTFSTRIQFDGKRYTVTDENGEQKYSHLIYSIQETPERSSGDYMECYLLSDDAEMTAQRYFDYVSSSMPDPFFPDTRLMFCDFK